MRGGHHVLHLLAVEDVDGREVGLGVAVLAGLGRGHVHHLAGAALDHDEAALLDLPGLGRVHVGRARGHPREVVVVDRRAAALLSHGVSFD